MLSTIRPEDVDQLFGVVLALLLRKHDFEDPAEIMQDVLTSLSERFRQKGEKLFVECLTSVRDFAAWLAPVGITLYNAFSCRQGVESPHAFTYKLRRDLLAHERKWLAGHAAARDGDLDDVFCCVKTYMRDQDLQQAPVLALPSRAMARVRGGRPNAVIPWHELSPKTIEQYMTLAEICDVELGLRRAAAALKALVTDRVYHLPSDAWLACTGSPREHLGPTGHQYFPHLPAQSWQLMVRHHRL